MDAIEMGAGACRMLQRAAWSRPCLAIIALVAVAGCDADAPSTMVQAEPVGRVEFNLVGQGSQGTLFRLRDAVVSVQGPEQTLFFDSEDDPDATSFSAVLPPGSYSSFLQEGWHLERVDSGKAVPSGVLISSNPDFFDVVAGERTRVALRFRLEGEVVVTNPGLLEISIEVEEGTGSSSAICSSDGDCGAGQVCCIAGFLGTCQTLEAGQACPLPDLTVSSDVARASLQISQESFAPDSCALAEGCVDAPGTRRLLRFSTQTPNIGASDLVLGDPTGTPGFEFAECHNHFHFEGYARYELLDGTGAVVAAGHKQAFCLLDSTPLGLPGAPSEARFHCGFQGLTRGWADIYDSSLDCQWVDVTAVPDGDYLLRISINPDHVIAESNFDNNTVEVPVTIGPPGPVDPLSSCATPTPGVFRECGWAFAPGFEGVSCVPGELATVGCGCISAGSCQGDPMLRVCEGTSACGLSTALEFVDDTCGMCPQIVFRCPASGTYSVLSGAYVSSDPFVCSIGGI
jgi:hypothetical protein